MAQGVRQKCRLFLEGREVPFIGAVLFSQPNQPLTATIDLVPLNKIKYIRPKTQVHIFVSDNLNFGDNIPRLAFEGEVSGRAYSKEQNARAIQINAIDYTAYWDEAKAYYYNPNFFAGKVGEVITGEPSIASVAKYSNAAKLVGSSTVTSLMVTLLLSQNNKDLIDGVANVIRTLSGVNYFYKLAYDRLRLNDRILMGSSGNLVQFLKSIQLESFLASYTGKQGGLISLREMLMSIMGLVFHDLVSVPFASKIPFSSPYSTRTEDSVIDTGENGPAQYLFIPDGYSLPPPKCNVIFPNQLQGFKFTDDFRAAPTRYSYRFSQPEWLTQQTPLSTYPIHYYPPSVENYMFNQKNAADNSLLGPSQLFVDPNGRTYAGVFYGAAKNTAVGSTSISPILREADFLTNEESIRGIFDTTDVFAPSISAMSTGGTTFASRSSFFQSIGSYMYFKKRFAPRQATADILFDPFIVPGFNCLILDTSDAGQTIIAKVQSITHQLRHEGCTTQLNLGYARDFDEIDLLTGDTGEPPLPPWFDNSLFGGPDTTGLFQAETTYLQAQGAIPKTAVGYTTPDTTVNSSFVGPPPPVQTDPNETYLRSLIKNPIVYPQMNTYYQNTLGCNSITDYGVSSTLVGPPSPTTSQLVSIRGAVSLLIYLYQQNSSSPESVDSFVYNYIKRPIPTIYEAFYFIGAKPAGSSDSDANPTMSRAVIPDEFATFVALSTGDYAGRFDGGPDTSGKDYPDSNVIAIRRQIIDAYVNLLKTKRGFRG